MNGTPSACANQDASLISNLPYSDEEIIEAKNAVLDANNIVDGYVAPVAWRGSEMMAVSAQMTKIHMMDRGMGLAQHV